MRVEFYTSILTKLLYIFKIYVGCHFKKWYNFLTVHLNLKVDRIILDTVFEF